MQGFAKAKKKITLYFLAFKSAQKYGKYDGEVIVHHMKASFRGHFTRGQKGRYTLNWRPDGLQGQSRCCGEQNNLLPQRDSNTGSSNR